jgi:DNA-binding NtrC family response regulator
MKNMKILVVDDEDIVLESCRKVLEADGFEVLLAASADQALEMIRDEPPALLLVDIKMPDRDGVYLIREVRKEHPDMPIVLMTGYTTKETVSEAAQIGVATLIAKPFTPDELAETVRRVVKKKVVPVFTQYDG